MKLQSGSQTITIHLLLNFPRSKGKHAMKFGWLIYRKNYFSSRIIQKASPRPFYNMFKVNNKNTRTMPVT